MSSELDKNVELWTKTNAEFTDADARRAWATEEFSWGIWGVPETEIQVFGDVSGLDAVELGCGTAYCSARLARAGARVVGVDPTPAQLETARRMQTEFELEFPLVADEDAAIARAYEAKRMLTSLDKRITYVIDPEGRIAHAVRAELNAGEHEKSVMRFLDERSPAPT